MEFPKDYFFVAQNFPEKFFKKNQKKSKGEGKSFLKKWAPQKNKDGKKSYASKTVPSKNPIFEKKSEKK